jgi:effector-binding domain-containing protein
MDYPIATQHVELQPIVSIRDRCKQDTLPGFLKTAIPELLGRLRLLGVNPAGPPFVIYHAFGADGIDAEVAVPTAKLVAAVGRVESRVMPPMTVARTVHMGPYEKLGDAYTALWGWIRGHGLETDGPVQERYLNGPGDRVAPSEYQTEIEMPVIPLGVAAPV